jgi:hypothetical protein
MSGRHGLYYLKTTDTRSEMFLTSKRGLFFIFESSEHRTTTLTYDVDIKTQLLVVLRLCLSSTRLVHLNSSHYT